MGFLSSIFGRQSGRYGKNASGKAIFGRTSRQGFKPVRLRLEALEERQLLSLSTGTDSPPPMDGLSYNLLLMLNDDVTNKVASWSVDWGDGLAAKTNVEQYSAADVAAAGGLLKHQYADAAQTYAITVTMTDAAGNVQRLSGGTAQSFDSTQIESLPGYAIGATLAFQSSGKYVLAQPDDNANYLLQRFNADGSLDVNFGAKGVVTTDVSCFGLATAAVQADDGIILMGCKPTADKLGASEFIVQHYSANGILDASFGVGGTLSTGLFVADGKLQSLNETDSLGAAETCVLDVLADNFAVEPESRLASLQTVLQSESDLGVDQSAGSLAGSQQMLMLDNPVMRYWDGGAGTQYWSDSDNWVGDVEPSEGDILVFDTATAITTYNDCSDYTLPYEFHSIIIDGAGVTITGNSFLLTDGITVENGATGTVSTNIVQYGPSLDFDVNGNLTISGQISGQMVDGQMAYGSGDITKTGSATLTLSGENAFLGDMIIEAGALALGNDYALGHSKSITIAGSGVTISGAGYSIARMDEIVVQAGASGTISAGLDLDRPLDLDIGGNLTISGQISGSGTLTKTGSATLTLSGNNDFEGVATIEAGKVALGHVNALGDTDNGVHLNGETAELDICGYQPTIGKLVLSNGLSTGAVINSGSSNGRLTSSSYYVLKGTISANLAGGSLTKIGPDDVFLSGTNNTYTGVTTVCAGTLELVGSGAWSVVTTTGGGANINGGQLVFDYTGGSTPAATIDSLMDYSYHSGSATHFDRGQFQSLNADSDHALGWRDGWRAGVSTANHLTVMYTLYGDATANRAVDISDLSILGQHWNGTGKVWAQADFNYNGVVDITDLSILGQNWNQGMANSPAVTLAGADAVTQGFDYMLELGTVSGMVLDHYEVDWGDESYTESYSDPGLASHPYDDAISLQVISVRLVADDANDTQYPGVGVKVVVVQEPYNPPDTAQGVLTVVENFVAEELMCALLGTSSWQGPGTGIVVTDYALDFRGIDILAYPHAVSTGVFVNDLTTGDYSDLAPYGIVLSTGNAAHYGTGQDYMPSPAGYTSCYYNKYIGQLVDPDSDQFALLYSISGASLPDEVEFYDPTQLDITFDVPSGYNSITFEVVFGTEEYEDFVGTKFPDAFGFFLNGSTTNLALVDAYGPPELHATRIKGVIGPEVLEGDPLGLWPINANHPQITNITGTELNGVLAPDGEIVLTYTLYVGENTIDNTLTFIIADSGDACLDCTAYIANLRGTWVEPPQTLAMGGEAGAACLLAESDPVAIDIAVVAQTSAGLRAIRFAVADMARNRRDLYDDDRSSIPGRDAAGWEWFVDSTPESGREQTGSIEPQADDRFDLLSGVIDELGGGDFDNSADGIIATLSAGAIHDSLRQYDPARLAVLDGLFDRADRWAQDSDDSASDILCNNGIVYV